jgi:hypothetical protein
MTSCGIPGNVSFVDVLQATKILTNKISCLNCKIPLSLNCDVIINGSINGKNPLIINSDVIINGTLDFKGVWAPWTPVPVADISTFTIRSGTRYTRIANTVVLNIDVNVTISSATNTIQFTGLPFVAAGSSTQQYFNSINIILVAIPLMGLMRIPGSLGVLQILVSPATFATQSYNIQGQITYEI